MHIWRRSYDVRPPSVEEKDERFPGHDPRYTNIKKIQLPKSESLQDTVDRIIECWNQRISKDILNNKKVLISAHGNSLRALVKYLDKIGDDKISELNIPTGVPLIYELDKSLLPLKHYYLK